MIRHEDIGALLGEHPIFGVLDEPIRILLAGHGQLHTYRRGETVFVSGAVGDRLYVILRGGVKVYTRSPRGTILELARRGRGKSFGEVALFDQAPRTASVDATATTTLWSLSRDIYLSMLRREASLVEPLLALLGSLIRENADLNVELALRDVRRRIAAKLLKLVPGSDTGTLGFTQAELAQMVAASRQTVNEVLRSFHEDGLIETTAEGIHILDADELRRTAE